jgi:integrase
MLKDSFETAENGVCDDVETLPPTLQDVFDAVTAHESLKPTRKRDLLSALRRFAKLTDRDLVECTLDMKQIREDLGEVTTGPGRPSHKTLTNLRSDLLAAIDVSKVRKVLKTAQVHLLPAWQEYFSYIPDRGDRYAVSRFARYCSKQNITPDEVKDAVITVFAEQLLNSSGVRKPRQVHRRTAQAWNKIRLCHPDAYLSEVTLPDYRIKSTNIQPSGITPCFAGEIEAYLTWCSAADPFDDTARVRALSPKTIILRRRQIYAALTALRDAGVDIYQLTSLEGLVSPEHVKSIIRQRYKKVGKKRNAYNEGIAKTLIAIVREWVKPGNDQIEDLKAIIAKLPKLRTGMTGKNRQLILAVSDDTVSNALLALPDVLLAPLTRKKEWIERDMVTAQLAVAIDLQLHFALRMQNLISLDFDTHIMMPLRRGDPGHLSIPGEEVKNGQPILFEIPAECIARIRLYRRIVKAFLGYRGRILFINRTGTRKSMATLAQQLSKLIKKHVAIDMTPHQFRHVAAKVILDAEPGNLEGVKTLLGHQNSKTTRNFYAELDTIQASKSHNKLIDDVRNRNNAGNTS